MTSIKSLRTKIFTVLSIIAFTWVILGDLVAMHINVICDIDVYNHQPFGKTQKSSEKCFKGKKVSTNSDTLFADLFDIIGQDYFLHHSSFKKIEFLTELNFNCYSVIIKQSGRSPPSFFV